LLTALVRMGAFALGTAAYLFLLIVMIRKRSRRSVEWALLAAVSVALLWYATGAITSFYEAGVGEQPSGDLERFLQSVSRIGLALIPAALLQVAFASRSRIFGVLVYIIAPFGWWALAVGLEHTYTGLLVVSLVAAMVGLLLRSDAADVNDRRFRASMAGALGVTIAGAAGGPEAAWIVLGGLVPALCLLYFITRFNVLGLFISRRIVFASVLGVVSAIYLLVARRASDWAQQTFEAFAPVIEVMLILAAVSVWIPLYAWMNRVLSKRTQVYADFGKRLIQETAAIFDFDQRLEYTARELGKTFKLRRVLLLAVEDPESRIATFGAVLSSSGHLDLPAMVEIVRSKRLDAVIGPRSELSLLSETGYNYLFPLWYEERLAGLLLVDPSPRAYLDEDEDILWGLTPQISHTIESCRLLERKISLEKALARSEHLASLGQMAATIAHEVKNPLSSIKTLAQLMREDGELNDGYRRDLSYIVAEVNRLNSCVEQLLTFARPVPKGTEEVAVHELIESISRVLNREYAEQRLQFQFRAPSGLTLKNVDPQSLHQIVLNLAINAAQASSTGGVVEICADRDTAHSVTITVADRGAGIPLEIQSRIFDPFFTTKQKGSGLGLAIVAKNVRHLGGDVRLDSPLDGDLGTAITVTLPVEAA
ncbi:MAG: ATP-binding protein, partial [Acidobacteriota bacterium]